MHQDVTPQSNGLPSIGDGFDIHDNEQSAGRGEFIKFDAATQSQCLYRDGSTGLPKGPWLAINCQKEAVCWRNQRPMEIIIERHGEPLPNIDTLNKAIPQSEWEEGFDGTAKPPWQVQYTVFLLDPVTGAKVTSSNSTFGQKLAFDDLEERVTYMRALRGPRVVPIVQLSSKQMRTKFGLKQRPHFEVIEWRDLGGSSVSAAPAPVKSLPGAAVAKPIASEIVGDEIPDHSAPFDDPMPDFD